VREQPPHHVVLRQVGRVVAAEHVGQLVHDDVLAVQRAGVLVDEDPVVVVGRDPDAARPGAGHRPRDAAHVQRAPAPGTHRLAQFGEVERVRQGHVTEPGLAATADAVHHPASRGRSPSRAPGPEAGPGARVRIVRPGACFGTAGAGLGFQALEAAGVVDHDLDRGQAFHR